MYAVIKTGGKQYKVSPGETVRIERLAGNVGERVSFDNVLMVNTDQDVKIGNPQLTGIPVIGEIVDQGKSKKIRIVKKKRRKNYRKTQGHRQLFTAVKVLAIGGVSLASGSVTYAASGAITGAASGSITQKMPRKSKKASNVASGTITAAASESVTKRKSKTKGSSGAASGTVTK
ncbi:MAG: 50S ribosomal protein L21 [Nitrospinae bacterium]|nr:50S ribosomal protein L21 [Nitrospinota bacterium]